MLTHQSYRWQAWSHKNPTGHHEPCRHAAYPRKWGPFYRPLLQEAVEFEWRQAVEFASAFARVVEIAVHTAAAAHRSPAVGERSPVDIAAVGSLRGIGVGRSLLVGRTWLEL